MSLRTSRCPFPQKEHERFPWWCSFLLTLSSSARDVTTKTEPRDFGVPFSNITSAPPHRPCNSRGVPPSGVPFSSDRRYLARQVLGALRQSARDGALGSTCLAEAPGERREPREPLGLARRWCRWRSPEALADTSVHRRRCGRLLEHLVAQLAPARV